MSLKNQYYKNVIKIHCHKNLLSRKFDWKDIPFMNKEGGTSCNYDKTNKFI